MSNRRELLTSAFIDNADFKEAGKAIAEAILVIANEPVRPSSMRSLLGEDKSKRVYNCPVGYKPDSN